MNKKRAGVFRWMEHLLVIGMAVMCLLVLWNVILRYVFNSGLPFSVEMSRLIFVWLVMIGSVLALRQGIHMGVDSLVRRLPRSGRLACFWIAHGLMLWCCWLLWQGSWVQTQLNWANLMPISRISSGWLYASGLAAAAAMGLVLLMNLVRTLRHGLDEPGTLAAEQDAAPQGAAVREVRP